jgi:hypothetical protein
VLLQKPSKENTILLGLGIQTGYGLESWSSIPGRDKRFFSSPQISKRNGNQHTKHTAKGAAHPMGYRTAARIKEKQTSRNNKINNNNDVL